MRQVYDRHLGPDWPQRASEPRLWETIESIDDGEIWETHQALKARLLDFVRRHAVRQAERRGEPEEVLAHCALALEASTR